MGNLKRAIEPMPDVVRIALANNNLDQAYEARPPYQRNDYLRWIKSAKRSETKERRLASMLDDLRRGHGYMGMAWNGKA